MFGTFESLSRLEEVLEPSTYPTELRFEVNDDGSCEQLANTPYLQIHTVIYTPSFLSLLREEHFSDFACFLWLDAAVLEEPVQFVLTVQ